MYKTRIKSISNYYWYLYVMTNSWKYYWIIENYDTNFWDLDQWEEISKELFDNLIIHNKTI